MALILVFGYFSHLVPCVRLDFKILLCMTLQNQWLNAKLSFIWGVYCNIPFVLLALLIIVLFYRSAHKVEGKAFRWIWLSIVLSFGFISQ